MRGEHVRSGLLEKRNNLLALHARKTLQKLLDRISRFQVIEEALRRHSRARKYRLTTEDFRILCDHGAHV